MDPSSGVHTQAIEGYWLRVKAKLKRMRGTTPEMLPGYLDEFMWRERFARNSKGELDAAVGFNSLISHIAIQCPV